MEPRFEGTYYFAVLELLEDIEKTEYHGRELFSLFETRYGSGNYLNFLRILRSMAKNGTIKERKDKKTNRVYRRLVIVSSKK